MEVHENMLSEAHQDYSEALLSLQDAQQVVAGAQAAWHRARRRLVEAQILRDECKLDLNKAAAACAKVESQQAVTIMA